MSTQDVRQTVTQKSPGQVQDLPGCIKLIILIFLLLLLIGEIASGEFRRFPDWGWLIWLILLIKLFLIALIIWLIKVQRNLKCQITEPLDCSREEVDMSTGDSFVRVKGTASGAVFGHYTLDLMLDGSSVPNVISYPGGGASGTSQVTNNELGRIDTSQMDGGTYTVVLTVFPSGAGSSKTCSKSFDLMRAPVWIDRIGHVRARDVGALPADPTERLKLIKSGAAPGAPETSVGGSISVEGGAYVQGCGKRMIEYRLEVIETPFGSPVPQADSGGAWTNIVPPLPYGDAAHPYYWNCLFSFPNYTENGYLTRVWSADSCFIAPATPKPMTVVTSWDTVTPDLNGRFTVRVHEKHKPVGLPGPIEELFDAATVWLDNRNIVVKLRRLKVTGAPSALDACEELKLSQFQPGGQADIIGQAWDPLILDPPAVPATEKPNDNFGSYSLQIKKDGGGYVPLPIAGTGIASNIRVPNVLQVAPPPQLDTDVLTVWDIVSFLDAGPAPSPYVPPPYPKIYHGERCAYNIHLHATDITVVSDGTTHNGDDDFPFCIVNDLR